MPTRSPPPVSGEVRRALRLSHDMAVALADAIHQHAGKPRPKMNWLRAFIMREVILRVDAGSPPSVSDIERICNPYASPLTVRSTINYAVSRGWLRKEPDAADKRVLRVCHTPKVTPIAEAYANSVKALVEIHYHFEP